MIFLELIQFEVFNDFVVAVFADDGHTEGETFRDAVRTVGRNSHRGPFTVAAENPVMDVIDGGVSSAGSGRMSKWYADAEFSDYLVEDYNIRKFLKKKLYSAGVSKIEIERASDRVKVIIYTAKPGVVIGKGGAEIEVTKKELAKLTDKKVMVDIKEIKRPDRDAQLVAENIAQQLENRVSFRRAMKSCMGRTMKSGAMGIKTCCSGRLGGADIARAEFYSEGTIPLQTLRADIDYGFAEANTTYGKVGVKVWIYKGEILPTKGNQMEGSDK